jgi:hypothetical protein
MKFCYTYKLISKHQITTNDILKKMNLMSVDVIIYGIEQFQDQTFEYFCTYLTLEQLKKTIEQYFLDQCQIELVHENTGTFKITDELSQQFHFKEHKTEVSSCFVRIIKLWNDLQQNKMKIRRQRKGLISDYEISYLFDQLECENEIDIIKNLLFEKK